MNKEDIIQQGTVVKYTIAIHREGFEQATDDFAVRLSWGLRGQSLTIARDTMQMGADGRWLLTFDTTGMIGAVTAATMLHVPDTDLAGGTMQEVDRQVIAFVVSTHNPRLLLCPAADDGEHTVVFERITEPGVVSKYKYLRDSRHRRLITADNQYIAVLSEE